MEFICNKDICVGCGLCVVKCPKQCISMKLGQLGHVYPVVNQTQCVDCKLCQKVCPALNGVDLHYPLSAYAAWAKNLDEYKSSTSGGVASVLSRYIISIGGVVYGCSVLPNVQIKHVRVDSEDGLAALKGSKYVQSSITDILPLLKQDVANGLPVLLISTPCQIAAVSKMFKSIPPNLFLVDIICHGTPSNDFLRAYLAKRLKLDLHKITNISFRSENAFSLTVYDRKQLLWKGSNLWSDRYNDVYYDSFIDGFTYRQSCYTCRYAQPNRCSDITIGDFWGLKNGNELPAHPYGVSVVLPVTSRGKLLLQHVSGDLNLFERPIQEAIDGNEQLRIPKKMNWRISSFRKCWGWYPAYFWYHLFVFDKMLLFRVKRMIKKYLRKGLAWFDY